VDTTRLVRQLGGRQEKTRALAFSPDGKLLFTGGMDGMVRRWDVVSGQPLRPFGGP
jgi:cytochrome c